MVPATLLVWMLTGKGRLLRLLGGLAMAGALAVLVAASGATDAHATSIARIAFISGGRVFTIAAGGSDRQQLTGGPRPRAHGGDFFPSWSPDRTQIALTRLAPTGGGDDQASIYVMNANGTNPKPLLASVPEATDDYQPAWKPDGSAIAFVRSTSAPGHAVSKIVVAPVGGGPLQTIVRERVDPQARSYRFVGEPAWLPSGPKLAYTRWVLRSRDSTFHSSLRLINANGSGDHRLQRDASAAAWSPDGSRIAFESTRDRNGEDCNDECSFRPELYVMDADGTQLVRMTRTGGAETKPSWSADGRRIVFASTRNHPIRYGDPELYSIRPNGHCLTWLTNGSPGSSMPSWEPDPLASTDPGACGATPRPPLIDYDAAPAERVRRFIPMWLGKRFGPMLLDYVEAGKSSAFFDYEDCGRYFPGDCGPDVQVQDRWVCRRTLLSQAGSANRLMKRRGALVAYRGRDGGLEVYTGPEEVKIYLLGGGDAGGLPGHLAALRALRGIHVSQPPDRLRRPVVPTDLLRRLRRTERIHERLGGVEATAQKLGVSSREVRSRLRLARVLGRFDSLGNVVCPSR
jgi:Tol biopolymer transport system component